MLTCQYLNRAIAKHMVLEIWGRSLSSQTTQDVSYGQGTRRPRPERKTALVTGVAARGIGGALATELHRVGYFVFGTARLWHRTSTPSNGIRPETGHGSGHHRRHLNRIYLAAVEEAVAQSGGRLDIHVNHAGAATHLPALNLDIDGAVAQMFDVNVRGPMRTTKAFSTLLINAKGRIINIGSIAQVIPLPFSSAYKATKAALHSFGDCSATLRDPEA
ncbi:hypothetical protein ACJZ2D_014271 [Fusarium nematophilum]